MPKVGIQGGQNEVSEIEQALAEAGIAYTSYSSEGFDGNTIITLVLEFVQAVAPPASVVLAAKVATRKQIQVKVDGVEVNANSEDEALKIIQELSAEDQEE